MAATVGALPLGSQRAVGVRLALILVAATSFAIVLVSHARRPFLSLRAVLVGTVAMLAVAVAVPPQGSADLWSYAAYGRTVAQYHRSPYRTDPDDVGPDPVTARVAPAWREAPSVYGPAFVVLAAAGAEVTGSSPVANRLFWQVLAAVAVLASLALLAREGADPGALAFLGLNPVIALAVVNGGHNDALVGLGVLGAVLLAGRRRPLLAGGLFGAAALVKIIAVVPLGAVVVWAWRGDDRKAAVRTLATGVSLVAGGYWLAGGRTALEPVLAVGSYHSRASVWSLLGGLQPALRAPLLSGVALAVATGLVVLGRWRPPLSLFVGSVLVISLVGAAYVLPWYVAWVLPVLALQWRSPVAAVGAITALGLVVSYVGAPRIHDHVLRALVHPVYALAMPVFFTGSLVWMVATARRSAPAATRQAADGRVP